MAIIAYPLNGIEYTAEDAQTYLCTRTSGVYSAETHFTLGNITGRTLTIGSGLAWMKISEFGGISFAVTEPVDVTVEGSGSSDRTDLIILRYNANTETREVLCKKNSNSVQQSDGIFELALYRVKVPALSTTIHDTHIEDLRATRLCGVMSDGVTKIPTETIRANFEAKLNDFINTGNNQIKTFSNDTKNALNSFSAKANNTLDTFEGKANNQIISFEDNASNKIATFEGNAINSLSTIDQQISNSQERIDSVVENFVERGDAALEELQESIENISIGTDVMLQTVFNPEGKVGQVAFKDELRSDFFVAAYTPKTSTGLENVVYVYSPGYQDLYDMIVAGKTPYIRAFKAKYEGEFPEQTQMREIERFLTYGEGNFNDLFDAADKTIDFQFVEMYTYVDNRGNEHLTFVFSTRLDSIVTDVHVRPKVASGKALLAFELQNNQ